MNKQKKSKLDILLERGAKEYADRITELSQQVLQEKEGVEMSKEIIKNMHELITNAFIEGELYMFRQLAQEQTKAKKPR